MRARRALLMAWLAAACAAEPSTETPTAAGGPSASGSSLVHHQGALWVTSPDDDAVVVIDPESLAVIRRIPVAGEPRRIVPLDDGRLAVSLLRGTDLAIVGEDVSRWPIPCGGADGLATADGRVLVACPFDDRLVVVEPRTGEVSFHPAAGRPTSVAVVGERVVVSAAVGGALLTAPRDAVLAGPTVDWDVQPVPRPVNRGISTLTGLRSDGGRLLGHYLRVDHDGKRDRPPAEGGYGRVTEASPRIESRILAACGGRYARFDGGIRVMSGVSAVAWHPGTEHLWVVNRDTANVAVLECPDPGGDPLPATLQGTAEEESLPLVAAWRVGHGARGIALSEDGRTAWVDVGFDHAIARLTLPAARSANAWLEPEAVLTRPTTPLGLSPAGERGRRLFHDARNTHLTPSGVVTCASCHPDGGDDGLSWFLHTGGVPRKLRRTPPAWHARPALMPLHWDGELTDPATLVSTTIRELMEGDALVVDVHAMATFLAERTLPVPPPVEVEAKAAARGKAIFGTAGCAGCHTAPHLTDGLTHDVLEPSADPDGELAQAVTPSLIAVRGRAPYLHDGRAPTLEAVLTTHNPHDRHGITSNLSAGDIRDLVAFLRTL